MNFSLTEWLEIYHLALVWSGVQNPTWKNPVPPKEPIPTRNEIT